MCRGISRALPRQRGERVIRPRNLAERHQAKRQRKNAQHQGKDRFDARLSSATRSQHHPPVTGIRTETRKLMVPRFTNGKGTASGNPLPRLTTTKSGARPPAVESQLSASSVHMHATTSVVPVVLRSG